MAIVLTGFEELLDRLSGIESRVVRKKILAAAMRHSLRPLLEEAKSLAPDDPSTPGNVITKYMRIAVLDQTSSSVLGKVGDTPKGFVGYFQEWGTEMMPAHPFLQVAAERTREEVIDLLKNKIWLGIAEELGEEEFDE